MKRLVTIERCYYLAFQDGRADDKEYSTKQEAYKALMKYSDFMRKGMCIMYKEREV